MCTFPPRTFDVDLVCVNRDANLIVWKFKDEDIARIPPPLSFGRKLEVFETFLPSTSANNLLGL
jgi:hypothetical protein